MKRVDCGFDVGIACRRGKTGCFEEVLAIDDHLRPAIDRNGGCHAVELGHGDGARREGVLLKAVDNVVICLDIKDAGFGPWQNVLKRMVDHIRKIASGKSRCCAGAKVLFLNRNHLDGVAGLLVEVVCHRLLLGKTLGLILGRPEPDRVSTRDTGNQGGNHRGRRRYQNWSHNGTPPEFPVFDCRSSAGPPANP